MRNEIFGVQTIAATQASSRPADIVEHLNEAPFEERKSFVAKLATEEAVALFDQPGLEHAAAILASLTSAQSGAILCGMSADRAAELLRHLPQSERTRLQALVDNDTLSALNRVLMWPERSAGSLMTTEFVSVPSSWTVGETLDHIRKVERTRETVYAIYVMDPATQRLIQAVSLRRLISGDAHAPVLSVATERAPLTVSPTTDQEIAANLISKYDLLALPVVENGSMLGIVTVDDIIDAMVQETTEDVQKFGGMAATDAPYMQIGFITMIRKRAGWLSALFLSEMLTASAMQHFDDELQKAIVLTLFIPLIMSSGGNSGSQATSLLIRSLALEEIELSDWWRVALREIPVGAALGSILGVIGIVRIMLWQFLGIYDYGLHWPLVAATVGAALIGIVMFGSLSGSMLPFMLKRAGFDPASASAPFVATLVDVTGLVIYFSVAYLILKGTLL